MPQKLAILLALLGLNLLSSIAQIAMDGIGLNILGLLLNAFLIWGVLSGKEAVRSFLIFASWIGLFLSGFALLGSLLMIASLIGAIKGIITLLTAGIGVLRCGYTIWCLNQPDVQGWMFRRSSGME